MESHFIACLFSPRCSTCHPSLTHPFPPAAWAARVWPWTLRFWSASSFGTTAWAPCRMRWSACGCARRQAPPSAATAGVGCPTHVSRGCDVGVRQPGCLWAERDEVSVGPTAGACCKAPLWPAILPELAMPPAAVLVSPALPPSRLPTQPPALLLPAAGLIEEALKQVQEAGMLFVVASGNKATDLDARPEFPASSR